MITANELSALSHAAVGLSGADLEALVKRARGRARRAGRSVEASDLHGELDGILRRGGGFPERTLDALAYHAAAKAVVAYAIGAGTISYITLDASGLRMRMDGAHGDQTAGHHKTGGDESDVGGGSDVGAADTNLSYADEASIERTIVLLFAGRASEALLGRRTVIYAAATGAAGEPSDLDAATALALQLELSCGADGHEPIGYGGVSFALLHTVPGLHRRVAARLARGRKDAERLVNTFEREVREAARMIRSERLVEGRRIAALLR